ncbi:MAG TPA: 8-oxoguanine deaminase [Anaerolineaceae bacterium]|nr:8-oxoguanine deaminase [Anaerolineaceae bacterium]HPT23590.1 8-oxoguanine deaminase [Anaerolineaceae bacterium]
MTTLLVKNAEMIVTMDDAGRELRGAAIFCRDGFIEQIGPVEALPQDADEVLDLAGHIVFPGMVNTHHHFYQTLTRAVPGTQDANLFNWLKTLYPIWARMTPEDVFISTQTALAELALTGCTTSSDHLYLFPNGARLDDEIEGARIVGLRLHAARGSMSLGESEGGLPPDSVTDSEENILKDSLRVIQRYHNPEPGSKLQIVLAPCSPFSVTGELMRQSAQLAREYHVHLHTHLAETEDEDDFCLQKFGQKPVAYMQSVDWIGNDVWFAHSVWVNDAEVDLYAQHGCGVAHCPSSNMRLASGIAPVMKMLARGVKLGLGVDGSASNDGSHMLNEARQAMLLARLHSGIKGASRSAPDAPPLMTARQALRVATRGGASVLGRTDIGSLEVGKCADFFAIDLNKVDYAGALEDPVAAVVFCAPVKANWTVVGGEVIVGDGQLRTLDLPTHVERHNKASRRLIAE